MRETVFFTQTALVNDIKAQEAYARMMNAGYTIQLQMPATDSVDGLVILREPENSVRQEIAASVNDLPGIGPDYGPDDHYIPRRVPSSTGEYSTHNTPTSGNTLPKARR